MDVKGVEPRDVVSEAIILQVSVKAGAVEGDAPSVLVPRVEFDPDDVPFVPEGDAIVELDVPDSQTQIFTGKIGLIVPVSREQWGQPDAASLISDAAREALVRKANRAFLSQADPSPATTPPAGVLNQTITVWPDDIATAASLDPVVDAIANIQADGGVATHVLAHPLDWATLAKLKLATDSNASLLGAGTDGSPAVAPQRRLLDVPVLIDRDVTQGNLVVLDKRAILSVIGQVLVATSQDYLFGKDSIATRLTWRFGAKVSRPERVVSVPLDNGSV
ncbi:phage major capsid protein [Mycobacterium lacus]|nr:phage major capsid protein [Mycobacterium lacus]MCV7122300.1 phage major capsid protein [Mycobacterium lacus]